MSSGRLFWTVASATGKERSPIVDKRALDIHNRYDATERKSVRPTNTNVHVSHMSR
jgi:hypothetical protein